MTGCVLEGVVEWPATVVGKPVWSIWPNSSVGTTESLHGFIIYMGDSLASSSALSIAHFWYYIRQNINGPTSRCKHSAVTKWELIMRARSAPHQMGPYLWKRPQADIQALLDRIEYPPWECNPCQLSPLSPYPSKEGRPYKETRKHK